MKKYRLPRKKSRGGKAKELLIIELDRANEFLRTAKANPESLHGARKRLKRMRALLHLTAPGFGPAARMEAGKIRSSARILGRHRESDVLDELFARELKGPDGRAIRKRLARLPRAGRPAAIARTRDVATVRRTLTGMRRRLKAMTVDEISGAEVVRRFRKTYRRACTAFETARDDPSEYRLHDWRKRLKRLLHQAELLSGWGTPGLERLRCDSDRVDDLLGSARDSRLLGAEIRHRLRDVEEVPEGELVLQRLEGTSTKLVRSALKRGTPLFKLAPRKFVEMMIRQPKP